MKKIILFLLLAVTTLSAQNAIIFGDVKSNQGGHSEGSMWVGGDWQGSYYEVNQHNKSFDGYGLILNGDNDVDSYLRVLNGNILYGGSKGTLQANNGNFSQGIEMPKQADYISLNESLSSNPAVAMNMSDPNNIKISLSSSAFQFFSVDASQLGGNKTLDFIGDQNTKIAIRIDGSTVNWALSVNYNPENIVWYSNTVTEFNQFGRELKGSVIVPYAVYNQGELFKGQLIANELNVYNAATLCDYSNPVGVPEPSSLILAVIGVSIILRRRK